jgi:hypothetical protein
MRITYFRFEITPSIMNPNTRSLRFEIERQGLPSLGITQEILIDDAESLLHLCFRRAENALKKEINRLKEIQNEPVRTRHTENNGLPQRNNDPA